MINVIARSNRASVADCDLKAFLSGTRSRSLGLLVPHDENIRLPSKTKKKDNAVKKWIAVAAVARMAIAIAPDLLPPWLRPLLLRKMRKVARRLRAK